MLFKLVPFSVLLFVPLGFASPLYYRTTSVLQTSTIRSFNTLPDDSSTVMKDSSKPGNSLDLTWMLEGNEKFQDQRSEFQRILTNCTASLCQKAVTLNNQ